MPMTENVDQSFHIELLDRFYGLFAFVGIAALTVGVPFIFFQKTAASAASLILISVTAIAWRISRRGEPQKSLKLFAVVLWPLMVVLLFAGLPPTTAAPILAIAAMLSVVVSWRAGILFGATYMLAWLAYIVLGALGLAPPAYVTTKPLVAWLMGAFAVWLVLLPIPQLIRNLRHTLSLQRATLESTADGILVIDNDGKITDCNQRFIDMWRIPREALASGRDQVLLDFVLEQLADPQLFTAKVKALYADPEASSVDCLAFKDGRVFERNSLPQRLGTQVVGRVWAFRDISERQHNQQRMEHLLSEQKAMLENEVLLRRIIETLDEGVLMVDAAGLIIFANPAAELTLGRQREALLGTHCPQLIYGKGEAQRACPLCTARTTRTPFFSRDMQFLRGDGTTCPVAIRATPMDDEAGGLVIAFYDISVEKTAEEKLAASERNLHALIDATPGTAMLLDLDGRIVTINTAGAQRLARTPEEIVGADFFAMLPEALAQRRRVIFAGVCASAQSAKTVDRRGSIFFETNLFPVADAAGEIQRVAIYAQDVTEARREEAIQTLFHEIGTLLLRREISLDTMVWHFCRKVIDILDVAFAWIGRKQPDGRVEVAAGAEQSTGYLAGLKALDMRWDAVDTDPVCSVLRHGKLQVTEPILEQPPGWQSLASAHGARRILCIPLTLEGGTYGVITLGLKETQIPDEVLLRQLNDMGNRLSLAMEAAIQQERLSLMETALESTGNAVFIADANGTICWANPAFGRLTGYAPEEAIGHKPSILRSGEHDSSFHAAMWQTLLAGNIWHGEVIEARADGTIFTVQQTITPLRDPETRISHFVSILEDISEQKAAQERVAHLANYDALTDLPNRRLFFDRLSQTLAVARRTHRSSALCFLDLDDFKAVNDRYGHAVGDQLLKAVAERLRRLVRESDTVARLAGDEFTVILAEVAGRDDCIPVAEKIIEAIGQAYELADGQLRIGVSVGIALFPDDATDSESLVRSADQAMYAAKAAGRGVLRFYGDLKPIKPVQLESTLTCPHCGHVKRETMPTDACQWFYECEGCHTLLKPKPGDCCVFCSYGDVPCPPIQESRDCCIRSEGHS